MKERLCQYEVYSASLSDFESDLIAEIDRKRGVWVACMNPHSFVVAEKDLMFQDALISADFLIPDGVGVIVASRVFGGSISHRITGSDLFHLVNLHYSKRGGRAFFLGSSPETLLKIEKNLGADYPGLVFAGSYSPPFKDSFSQGDLEIMCSSIRSSKADILWVAMTAPKQEKWIKESMPELDLQFAGAIGAVFDFYTGNVKRSNKIYQQMGLEWLPRLLQQPRRLWRRTIISAPIFFYKVLKDRILR